MRRLVDERALVIGASSGIGRAIAKAFDAEGAEVAIASRSVEKLRSVADDARGEMLPVECDVRETDTVEETVETVVDTFGGIDIVVNSAGVITRSDMIETDDEEMERIVDTNLKGTMRVARAVLPELVTTNGTFVPVSSQLGEVGVEGASVYCGTKGGINNLTRQLAVEYAEEGVRVNALAPGIVTTEMNREVREAEPDWEERKASRVPMSRLATPEEIAQPAVFLASNEASYMTGHVLVVDGGYIAR